MEHSIESWVENSSNNNLKFKQAAHIILNAISTSDYLKPKMVMKGGVLLAIRYESSRYTTDIDFSSTERLENIDLDEFEMEMNESLKYSSDQLSYGIDCVVQSASIEPRRQNPSFPTLQLKIGYASTNIQGEMARLKRKQSPHTIKIDYSFNELTFCIEDLVVADGESISVYGFTDIIAEKIRSIIQQVSRNRNRRQDVYDLKLLFDQKGEAFSDVEKFNILSSLIRKSEGRLKPGVLNINSLDNLEVRARSQRDYDLLESEVSGELYDFDAAYDEINSFYKSLPWSSQC